MRKSDYAGAPPGVSIVARRPSVFYRVPRGHAVFVAVLLLVAIGACYLVSSHTDGPAQSGGGAAGVRVVTGIMALWVTISTFLLNHAISEQRARMSSLVAKVATLYEAWNSLGSISGIQLAVERNLALARDRLKEKAEVDGAEPGCDIKAEQLARIEQLSHELRKLSSLTRPADPNELKRWLRRRYETVKRVNSRIKRTLLGLKECDPVPDDIPLEWQLDIVPDVIRGLNESYGRWESSWSAFRAEVNQWSSLVVLADRCHSLVKYWWVYCINDVQYWKDGEEAEERRRAFDDAAEAVESLRQAVMGRDLGVSTLRSRFIQGLVSKRAVAALDRLNQQV